MSDTDERLAKLESRLAYLERHLEQQDREMLKQSEHLKLLTREFTKLKDKTEDLAEGKSLPQEKPPHY